MKPVLNVGYYIAALLFMFVLTEGLTQAVSAYVNLFSLLTAEFANKFASGGADAF